jgi:type 1 glutamine amidotransferase/nicotinamidase-related amidase
MVPRFAIPLGRFLPRSFVVTLVLLSVGYPSGTSAVQAEELPLRLRSRVETSPGSGRFHTVTRSVTWDPKRTAAIVCDMWDLHHSLNAVRRAEEMAPRMNDVLRALRKRGVTIIHAPSSCMDFYAEHSARRRALEVPRSARLPDEIDQWCHQIPAEQQGEYPIDQSDGGEDDDPEELRRWGEKLAAMGRNPRAPWVRQTELLEISDQDYISDDGAEIWSILERHGRDQVVLLGVHTNMCVLGRPFGLRNLVRHGKHVVLMRDMTDTMYNPARAPFVSHFTGTDLIVAHIEKWVCPTITSDQLVGGEPFRFAADTRVRVGVVMAEPEYQTETTLPRFAARRLGTDFQVHPVFAHEQGEHRLPGLDVLDEADVLLISVRRRPLPPDERDAFNRFVRSGKGIVGIRTANHAFSLRGGSPPDGLVTWESWDQEVLGGNYSGHHGSGPQTQVRVVQGAADHPILRDVDVDALVGYGSLYVVSPLRPGTVPLLMGEVPGKPAEPVAWTHRTASGGRVFYTSLGDVRDFEQGTFQQLLHNALLWAAD